MTGIVAALFAVAIFVWAKGLDPSLLPRLDQERLSNIWAWIYDNLRLSLIPFGLVLGLYFFQLGKLDKLLASPSTTPDQVMQAENWINASISMFFGIGVIWTAIGMRSALLAGLSNLSHETVARIGAFEILHRLVEGGILLALSTTIVGAGGGYLMRLYKIVRVGARQQSYYRQLNQSEWDTYGRRLERIESHLARLVTLMDDSHQSPTGKQP